MKLLNQSAKSEKYIWTKHSQYKMRHYGLSAQRIKRIIRHPARTEEAIVPNMIASMQPAGNKTYSEIWTIYKSIKSRKQIKIITAWKYPGKSPARNPIPKEILEEIRSII
ncbi:hypothetical protein HY838_01715 [Candidatus Azambacteria bacterium]|nr:hypothetical protein [Candidatus Azambacteria bacterium]